MRKKKEKRSSLPKRVQQLDALTRAKMEQEAREQGGEQSQQQRKRAAALQEEQRKRERRGGRLRVREGEGVGTKLAPSEALTPAPDQHAKVEVSPGSNEGLKQEPAGEGSEVLVWVKKEKGSMSNDQLLFAAQAAQKLTGPRYVPPPPPPKEIDPVTARIIAAREEQKKEKARAHFEALREKHKNDPDAARRSKLKRRVARIEGGGAPRKQRERKPVDPNAPRPENPYAEGSMKRNCYADFLANPKRSDEKHAEAFVKLGASQSTSKGWLRSFQRYKAGGEK